MTKRWRWHRNCCNLLALQLHIASSQEYFAEKKTALHWVRIYLHQYDVYIRPYCQLWQITMKRNFGALCEWIWKRPRSCLNLQMGLCYWSETGAQRWRLLCRFVSCRLPNYISPTRHDWHGQLTTHPNISTCQDGLPRKPHARLGLA